MGSKKSKAPAAPDYQALAKTQYDQSLAEMQRQFQANQAEQERVYQQNLQAAQDKTWADRATQTTPYGTLSWSQDPTTGQWTQATTYSPEIQAMLDKQLALQNQGFGLQEKQMSQLQELINRGQFQGPAITAKYDQAFADKYATDFATALTARLNPVDQQAQEGMATRLRLQGLQPGTEAYDRAYQNLLRSQGDVRTQANLQAQLAGQSEARQSYQTELSSQQAQYDKALQEYLLPWQTYQATQGITGNVAGPTFSNYNQASGAVASGATMGQAQIPDIVGAAQQQYAQQMQQYNEAQAKKSSKGSSIGTIVGGVGGFMVGGPAGAALGASAGGALGSSFSDLALKEDVETIPDEVCYSIMQKLIPISFGWAGTDIRDAGISAQQMLELAPELVERAKNGTLKVNYTKAFAYLLGAFRHLAKLEATNERL